MALMRQKTVAFNVVKEKVGLKHQDFNLNLS